MSSNSTAEPPAKPGKSRSRLFVYLARVGAGSLFLSIAIHVIFVGVATFYVVSVVGTSRKVTFTGGGSGDGSGGAAAAETRHTVSVARQNTTPVPSALSQKIVVDGASAIALPELPTLGMPAAASSSSSTAGVGGLGGGLGTGGGMGTGAGAGTGALRMMPFGLSQAPASGALTGTLYLMPSEQHKKNEDEVAAFKKWIKSVSSAGWSESKFSSLPKSPKQLFTTQILIPKIVALEAPKAFGVDKQKSLVRFYIRYRGKVSPPRNGRWRFVGYGDDVLVVRVSGKVVLEASAPWGKLDTPGVTGWTPRKQYVYPLGRHTVGDWVQWNKNDSYDLEISMTEEPRTGDTSAVLLVEEEGATYAKTKDDSPILPPWTLAPEPTDPGGKIPLVMQMKDVPVWISRTR